MTFSWRRWKSKASKGMSQEMKLTIPTHFRCPVSLDLMKDPVTLSTGITYDRESIDKWIDAGNMTCPVTNQVLRNFDQIPNHSIRKMIQDWCVENKSFGVERIQTPRIPITPYEVTEICSRMEAATRHGDARECQELLEKIKNLANESERNKRCIVGNGIGSSLADMLESFAHFSVDSNVNLLKEILSALTWTFPLDRDGISKMKSVFSIHCMSRFLKSEDDLSSRQNAIFVLRQLISVDQGFVEGLMGIDGIEETLFQMVKVPIGSQSTKASLVVIHHIMSSPAEKSGKATLKFVQMGLIPLILEILVDGDKSLCEKALCVMDSICSCTEGRESAYANALTIPLLIKKILRVSNAATDISISCLWKLCLGENGNALFEAVQHGASQKLLVVLQIENGERTKEKSTELLKLINLHRDKLDCFDSSLGLGYIKRSNDL